MRPPTSFNNYIIQFAVVNPSYHKIGAGNNGPARYMNTLAEAVSAAGIAPGGCLDRLQGGRRIREDQQVSGPPIKAASTMQSIDRLHTRLETKTRLRMAGDGHGRCAPLPLCARRS